MSYNIISLQIKQKTFWEIISHTSIRNNQVTEKITPIWFVFSHVKNYNYVFFYLFITYIY